MDNREFDLLRRKRIENVVLIICTIYAGYVAVVTYNTEDSWVTYVLEFGLVILWMVHLTSFKSYQFRAGLSALIASLCVLLYCVVVDTEIVALIAAAGFSIVLGLYEIQSLLFYPLALVTAVVLHHLLISKTIPMDSFT